MPFYSNVRWACVSEGEMGLWKVYERILEGTTIHMHTTIQYAVFYEIIWSQTVNKAICAVKPAIVHPLVFCLGISMLSSTEWCPAKTHIGYFKCYNLVFSRVVDTHCAIEWTEEWIAKIKTKTKALDLMLKWEE